MRLSLPLLQHLLFSLTGAAAFSLLGLVQKNLFNLSVPAPYYVVPSLSGALVGLLWSWKHQRSVALNHEAAYNREQLHQLAREREDRYRQLFQQSRAVQLLIDPESGKIVETNEAARTFYGYSEKQLHTMTIFDLNIDSRKTTQHNIARALACEQLCIHLQHRLQSGEVLPVAVYTVPLPHRGRTLLHSVVIDLSMQDRAESHLRRKTLEQRLLLDSIPVSIWYLKDPETYGSVNQAFADNFGRSPLDIAHHRLDSVLRPEMLALALASNRQVFQGKQPLHYEQWTHFGNNEPHYMAITKTPKLDDQGQVDFVVCTATDITGMQQARELLRIERDLHIALTAAHSLEETLELCLKKAIDISKTDCGSLYQISATDGSLQPMVHRGLPPACVDETAQYLSDAAQARRIKQARPIYSTFDVFSKRVCNDDLRDEGLKAMAIIPITFEGKVIAALHVASHEHDEINAFSRAALERIVAHLGTFLKQKEQAAQILQSRHNLESLFNTIRDMVLILDMQGRILYLNAAAVSRLRYHPAELLGQPMQTIHPPTLHQEVEEIFQALLNGQQNFCSLPFISKDGEEIPVETHITFGQWSGQKVLIELSRDIGQRLQLEQQQRLLLKNEGMERMAGAIAHHFNNLMAIVAGNVELALEETAINEEAYLFLANALDGSRRASELGQSLLIYTGHFSQPPEQLELTQLCKTYLEELQTTLPDTIQLDQEYLVSELWISANRQQLHQVLSTLVTNAVEVIDQDQGHIWIRLDTFTADKIKTDHFFPAGWQPEQKQYVSLEVRDNGDGMNQQQLASIFDPFYSEKFIGRGLGLPLALSIVKKLGGAIAVQSKRSQGSVFQVLLPEVSE